MLLLVISRNWTFLVISIFTTLLLLSMTASGMYDGDEEVDGAEVSEKNQGLGAHGGGEGSGGWLTGRFLGFLCLATLVALAPTGGFLKRYRKRLNKFFGGGKKRMNFHCYLSYFLLLLVILHAMVLMYTHYRDVRLGAFFLMAQPGYPSINIGFWAFVLMSVVGILGILQKKVTKLIGGKNWRRAHGWLTWLSILMVVVHALWIGTTIGLPLRDALGI